MDIVFHGSIVVQMLFVDIQKHRHMGRDMDIFQLMAGEFTDDPGLFMDLFQNVEGGNADIACQDCVSVVLFQDMVEQGGDRTLSLGACDADDLPAVGGEEDFHLGGDLAVTGERVPGKDDARTLSMHP